MEIERKFLVNEENLNQIMNMKIKSEEILQAYLEIGKIEKRVRKRGNSYFYTVKTIEKSDLFRGEEEKKITKKEFDELMVLRIGNSVSKRRYEIPIQNDLIAELDIYNEALEGLRIVEVEFPNIEMAKNFIAPEWFGEEVTYNKAFRNQSLALNGNPLS